MKMMPLRYAIMLEQEDFQEMHVIEVDGEVVIKTCEVHDYNYTVIYQSISCYVPPDIMILFEKIRWKNFLSTGNQYTDIKFR